MDYEDKVAHLQAFPVCTSPLGNQAFELVPRPLLVAEGLALGYPVECMVIALAMYQQPRRLVYRRCVADALRPARGIAAGSAFATTELQVVLTRAFARLRSQERSVVWAVHV